MPVNRLFCEGSPKGPDVRVIAAILRGTNCLITPLGAKYGMGDKIRLARELNNVSIIAGLLDRDFDEHNTLPVQVPRDWRVAENTLWLGWRWERKEIENYLLDPQVVRHAIPNFPISDVEYAQALHSAAQGLAEYTAARTALSIIRPRFEPLSNSWGAERGKAKHIFPPDLSIEACRTGILLSLQTHAQNQVVGQERAIQQFESCLPECHPGGSRFEHFLTFFAGKDLFCALDPHVRLWGFASYSVLKEKILKGIEDAQSDVWSWLPEWGILRQQVIAAP